LIPGPVVRKTPFGRYLLLDEIARGGMARVYRALLRTAPSFERPVALKRVLLEFCDDPEFVRRFGDEAAIASTLSHGNIVQVFDFGEVDGEYYLTMELVDGPDLATLLAASDGLLPLPAALFIGAGAGRGLGAAHKRRDEAQRPRPVIHRDVSPHNVLLTRAGEVKVADFGIAKASGRLLSTRPGLVLGKVRYMSPEQARGGAIDVRSDVYSLGAVLFQLLVGHPPFDGQHAESIIEARLQNAAPPPSRLNPAVPPEVDRIVSGALARNPADRQRDGDLLARQLEQVLHTVAPAYCSDDLAALVRQLTPPPPGPASQLPPGRPAPDPAAATLTAGPVAKVDHRAPTELLVRDRAVAPHPSTARTAGRPRRPVRFWLMALLAVVGGGIGLNLRLASSGHPIARPGEEARAGPWALRLIAARQVTARRLELSLRLRHRDGADTAGAGAFFRLLGDDGSRERPRFWFSRDARSLSVVFAWGAGQRATLRFAPPDGEPLDIGLSR
jgi:hypothetical protein